MFALQTTSLWHSNFDELEESIGCSESERTYTFVAPTYSDLLHFCTWYFDLVNKREERRRETLRANHAAGAPANNRRPRRRNHQRQMASLRSNGKKKPPAALVASDHEEMAKVDSKMTSTFTEGTITDRTRQFCTYLSSSFDEEPQLLQEEIENCALYDWNDLDKVMLLVSMARYVFFLFLEISIPKIAFLKLCIVIFGSSQCQILRMESPLCYGSGTDQKGFRCRSSSFVY